jgi:hypothetical protein
MDPARMERIMPVWVAVSTAVTAAIYAFFYFNRNAGLKRRLLLPLSLLVGLAILALLAFLGAPTCIMIAFVPGLAVAILAALRTVHFCDACGRTLRSHNPFSKPGFCSHCGKPL